MHSRISDAVRDALLLVRKSNVKDATTVIQAALMGSEANHSDSAPTPSLKRISLGNLQSSESPTEALRETDPPMGDWPLELGKEKFKTTRPSDKSIGNFTSRTYPHTERNLDYMLYVPPHHDSLPQSLLLMLHGCTQNPTDFARGTEMNNVADEFNLVVAYPFQPKTANSSGCWNWFDQRHQKLGSGEPAMLAALTEKLRQEFNISEKRVFAAGLSAGGAMAEILAHLYPGQFSAVGVHSGLPYGAATTLGNAFKAMKGGNKVKTTAATKSETQSRRIVFHGSGDATVHPSNGDSIVSHARRNFSKLAEIKTTAKINGRTVDRTILENDQGISVVEHWIVMGAGHAWSGGNAQGSHADPIGPNASREMVRFFLNG